MDVKDVRREFSRALRSEGLVKSMQEGSQIFDNIFNTLKELVLKHNKIITPMGFFEMHRVSGRKGINPQTREELRIPPKYSIKFTSKPKVNEQVKKLYRGKK